jgi:histone H3/H4
MKAGSSNFEEDNINHELIHYAQSLIALFIAKATKLGSRYCVLSNRTTLTKEDIEYALKFQAIEFIETTDIKKELDEINEELMSLLAEDDDEYNSEDDADDTIDIEGSADYEEPFKRANPNLIKDQNDALFVKKMHHYYEYWNQWKPKNYFEEKIKQAITPTDI